MNRRSFCLEHHSQASPAFSAFLHAIEQSWGRLRNKALDSEPPECPATCGKLVNLPWLPRGRTVMEPIPAGRRGTDWCCMH